MLKTQPVCTVVLNKSWNEALSEVEKDSFIPLSGKGTQITPCPQKTVSQPVVFREEFYSNSSKSGLLIRIKVCAGPSFL